MKQQSLRSLTPPANTNPRACHLSRSRERVSLYGIRVALAGLMICVAGPTGAIGQDSDLKTVAESSDFQATAPYADVIAFCETLANSSDKVHLSSMGRTHENRDIPLLILADPPIKSAAEAKADPRPVVFAMGNIHAGEVCGKETLLMLARDLVKQDSKAMKELILVSAPIYNADGNERFSTTNRPGQIGPAKGMGQRPNAMGLDLNRDHMKLESPEARSLAKLMSEWEPIIAMDLHTTDGSFHRFKVTYDSPRHPATDAKLLEYGRDKFLPTVSKQLKAATGDLSFFYGNFDRSHENWRSYPGAPRYSTHYFGLRNALGILSEAYAFATYRERVLVTYHFVDEILKLAITEKAAISKLIAEARTSKITQIAVGSKPTAFERLFTIPAWKETVAGRGRQAKDTDEATEYQVKYHGIEVSSLDIKRPAHYVVPKNQTKVIENLTNHGVRFETVKDPREATVTAYKITGYEMAKREFQGHKVVSGVQVTTAEKTISLQLGDIVVPTDQPLGRLIVNLLEPQATDGLCAWNYFDDALESKDYPIFRIE